MILVIETKDMYGEYICEELIVEKEIKSKEKKYSYEKSDRDERGNIIISDSKVEIVREGEISSHLILERGKKTEFKYKNPYLKKVFNVECEEIIVLDKEIKLSYTIYDDDTLLNRLVIRVWEKEEEKIL